MDLSQTVRQVITENPDLVAAYLRGEDVEDQLATQVHGYGLEDARAAIRGWLRMPVRGACQRG